MKNSVAVCLFLAAALVLGLGCDKATPVAPLDALIDLSINPTRIPSNGQADVTVIARKMDGFPVNEGTEINLSTNLGRLEPTMVLTDERGMASAVLFGDGDNGMATVTAISGGVTVTAELQVGIPPVDLLLTANPSSLTVPFNRNRETKRVRLVASVGDENGVPIPGLRVSFETDAGVLSEDRVETDDNGEARSELTVTQADLERAADGVVLVTAEVFAADGSSITDTQEIEVLGLPTFLTLETSQSSIPAEGGAVELIATVTDDTGEPVQGVGVQFETTVGSVASRGGVVTTDRNGQAFDVLSASEQDLAAVSGNTFTVSAQIAGTSSGAGETFDTAIIAIQGLAPIAGFTATVSCRTVTFTNTTTPASTAMDPITFDWLFGDGVGTNNVENPIHTYAAEGTYMVNLTATSAFGTDSVTQPVVVDPTPLPAFSFSISGTVVSFDASASVGAAPLTYEWDFGQGGATGSGVTTSHDYGGSGTFTVSLVVTTTCAGSPDASAPLTQTVVVP